jgi:AraC-like DNA-binding protein
MFIFDKPLLDTFSTVENGVGDLDRVGGYTRTLNATNTYRLRDKYASKASATDVLSSHSGRRDGALSIGYNTDRFAADIDIVAEGSPRYGLVAPLSGAIELVSGPSGKAEAHGSKGFIFRGQPGTRFRTTDDNARMVVWIDAGRLERMLQARLGEPPREGLMFTPGFDWSVGRVSAVWRLVTRLLEELRDPEGLTTETSTRETFTDLLLQALLDRLPHNHSVQMKRPVATAIPAHLRRAEAFMDSHADKPITMTDVAAAAGCGTATLYAAFRQFRETTPLAALHAIRLEHVRGALQSGDVEGSTREIARRFGFTNPSRFLAAYGKRFGERPNETRRSIAKSQS